VTSLPRALPDSVDGLRRARVTAPCQCFGCGQKLRRRQTYYTGLQWCPGHGKRLVRECVRCALSRRS